MLQCENEYGYYGDDKEYLAYLKEGYLRRGMNVPLFTSDGTSRADMLDGMIDRMEEELGQKTTVIATGGIAKFVIPMCRRSMIYDKDLLLKGLRILYENNKKKN